MSGLSAMLTVADMDHHAFTIDVDYLQHLGFAQSHTKQIPAERKENGRALRLALRLSERESTSADVFDGNVAVPHA